MKTIRRLLTLGIFVALLVGGWQFAAANATPTSISYVWGELGPFPLWAIVAASVALGAGVVSIYSSYKMARLGLVARRYRKTMTGLESEVHQLRNLPIGDPSASASLPPGASAGADAQTGAPPSA